MILTGQIRLEGVYIPTIPEIYQPVLKELESLGIGFREKSTVWDGE
jgi:saccharopine dehydrogenase (NADP+, L-glutamate forming)